MHLSSHTTAPICAQRVASRIARRARRTLDAGPIGKSWSSALRLQLRVQLPPPSFTRSPGRAAVGRAGPRRGLARHGIGGRLKIVRLAVRCKYGAAWATSGVSGGSSLPLYI